MPFETFEKSLVEPNELDDLRISGNLFIDLCFKVEAKLKANNLENQRVVCSSSGGLDSTTLFYVFWHLLNQKKILELVLFHANYQLRGEDSEADELFCRKLAALANVRFLSIRPDAAPASGIQEWARHIRRNHYKELSKEGYIVALGHTQNDLAETILMRLARGSSLNAASGMQVWKAPIFRPLLQTSRRELEDIASASHLKFREDSSNQKMIYTRNIIRHHVLAELEALYPGAAERICLAFEDAERLNDRNKEMMELCVQNKSLNLAVWQKQHGLDQKAILHGWLIKSHDTMDRQRIDTICAALKDLSPSSCQTLAFDEICLEVRWPYCSLNKKLFSKTVRHLQHAANFADPRFEAFIGHKSLLSVDKNPSGHTLSVQFDKIWEKPANIAVTTILQPGYIAIQSAGRVGRLFLQGIQGGWHFRDLMQKWKIHPGERAHWMCLRSDDGPELLFCFDVSKDRNETPSNVKVMGKGYVQKD